MQAASEFTLSTPQIPGIHGYDQIASLFTGYFRDQETGLDYAQNRYHQPGMGRFLTVDPYHNSAGPIDPGSWNRYAYVRGDPVNSRDRRGLQDCEVASSNAGKDDGIRSGPSAAEEDDCAVVDPDLGYGGGVTFTDDVYDSSVDVTSGTQDCSLNPNDPECYDPPPYIEPPQQPTKPTKPNPCSDTTHVAFVKNNLANATTLAQKLNVSALFVLATSAVESTYGTSNIAQSDNNYFGIHWGTLSAKYGASQDPDNPVVAQWSPDSNGYIGSGNVMVALAISDGAKGVTSASTFFTDIHKQFGVGNSSYVSQMLRALKTVTALLGCP